MAESKNIVLVKDGEPLPQHCGAYPLRIGNLASELTKRGHRVHWYSSTFLHQKKVHFCPGDLTLEELGYTQRFLYADSYQRNVSLQRLVHHSRFALKLFRELSALPKIDILVCCVPTIEASAACLLVAKRRAIPLVIDIRDPWPDFFLTIVPQRFRILAASLLRPYILFARFLFRTADSLTAVSQGFLEWAQQSSGRIASHRKRDRVFFHGAHSPIAPPSPLREEWQTPKGVIRHVFLGGFGRNYDFKAMSEAIESIGPKAGHHFFFIGAGSESHQLQERLEPYSHVTFTGWLDREDAYNLGLSCQLGWTHLRKGDNDFLPNKFFEYGALGLGLVSARCHELQRITKNQDLGFEYSQDDSTSLTEQLRNLRPEEIESWQKQARMFWSNHGNARACANAFADHIEDLLTNVSLPRVAKDGGSKAPPPLASQKI